MHDLNTLCLSLTFSAHQERRAVVDWSPKREARMLVAARELKEQLSASPQAEVFIEELLPEWDFKLAVTRDEADDACRELYAAFEKTNPVQRLRDDGHLKGITVQNIECESLRRRALLFA